MAHVKQQNQPLNTNLIFLVHFLQPVATIPASAVVSLDFGSHASLQQSPIMIQAVIVALMAPLPQFADQKISRSRPCPSGGLRSHSC